MYLFVNLCYDEFYFRIILIIRFLNTNRFTKETTQKNRVKIRRLLKPRILSIPVMRAATPKLIHINSLKNISRKTRIKPVMIKINQMVIGNLYFLSSSSLFSECSPSSPCDFLIYFLLIFFRSP